MNFNYREADSCRRSLIASSTLFPEPAAATPGAAGSLRHVTPRAWFQLRGRVEPPAPDPAGRPQSKALIRSPTERLKTKAHSEPLPPIRFSDEDEAQGSPGTPRGQWDRQTRVLPSLLVTLPAGGALSAVTWVCSLTKFLFS